MGKVLGTFTCCSLPCLRRYLASLGIYLGTYKLNLSFAFATQELGFGKSNS